MSSNDIYTILSEKPHNSHYLKRYCSFINSFITQSRIKHITETHHICPKAEDMFPEYSCLKTNLWNSVHLTKRQHFIAHWLLSRAFNARSQSYSFWCMCNKQSPNDSRKRDYTVSSRTYEYAKHAAFNDYYSSESGKLLIEVLSTKATERWADGTFKEYASNCISTAMRNKLNTDIEYRNKMSSNAVEISSRPEVKEKISKKAVERNSEPEYRKNTSDKTKTAMSRPDVKENLRLSIERRKKIPVCCPHCNFVGNAVGGNMKRYHFDNCKSIKK